MIRRIIFSLKGWGIASLGLAIALLYQHFFRNPLCFSWECIGWFVFGLLLATLIYSFVIMPLLPKKQWIKNTILSFLFLITYFSNLFIFKVDYYNNLLASNESIITISLLIVGISCLTANVIRYSKNNLIIRQVKIR